MERAWSRKELKSKSKSVLQVNYWRVVLVAFVLSILCGGSFLMDSTPSFMNNQTLDLFGSHVEDKGENFVNSERFRDIEDGKEVKEEDVMTWSVIVISAIGVLLISLLICVCALLITVFVFNPFYVGTARFMVQSFDKKPRFKEVFYAFERRYKNVAAIMLLRGVYTFLWTLLFIIPGIVKRYEYRMVPYILAETPDIDAKTAISVSKQMMQGQKWKTFLLDLSFIGWHILGALTLGILGVFYVSPYIHLTNAALYRKLKGKDEQYDNIYIGD